MGLGFQESWCGGEVGAEDGVEFGDDGRVGGGGGVQEVEGVGDGGGGGVVAGEDEGLELVDGVLAEDGVEFGGGFGGRGGDGVFFLVGLEREVDDGAFAVGFGFWGAVGIGVAVGGDVCARVSLVHFFADEAVELALVEVYLQGPEEVEAGEGIDHGCGRHQPNVMSDAQSALRVSVLECRWTRLNVSTIGLFVRWALKSTSLVEVSAFVSKQRSRGYISYRTTFPIISMVNLVAYSSISNTSSVSAFSLNTSQNVTLASTMYGTRVMRCALEKPGLNMVLNLFHCGPSTLTILLSPSNFCRNMAVSLLLGSEVPVVA